MHCWCRSIFNQIACALQHMLQGSEPRAPFSLLPQPGLAHACMMMDGEGKGDFVAMPVCGELQSV